jgi:hypothetical protein
MDNDEFRQEADKLMRANPPVAPQLRVWLRNLVAGAFAAPSLRCNPEMLVCDDVTSRSRLFTTEAAMAVPFSNWHPLA